MHMIWTQYFFPIAVTTFFGWAITWVAIILLFHPHNLNRILGINFQGIIPRKHQLISKKLAQWISKEFISFSEIEERVTNPDNLQQLKPEIEKHIDFFLRTKLKETFPMLSVFIGDKIINQLKEAFLKELETLFPLLMKNYIDKLQQDIDIEKIIETKLTGISTDKIEYLFKNHIKNRILLSGACFGFLIGSIQIIFTILIDKLQ